MSDSLTVTNNLFVPLTSARHPGVLRQSGHGWLHLHRQLHHGRLPGLRQTEATNGLVEGNTVTGTGTGCHVRHVGLPGSGQFGKTIFRANTISGTCRRLPVCEQTNDVTIEHNVVSNVTDRRRPGR